MFFRVYAQLTALVILLPIIAAALNTPREIYVRESSLEDNTAATTADVSSHQVDMGLFDQREDNSVLATEPKTPDSGDNMDSLSDIKAQDHPSCHKGILSGILGSILDKKTCKVNKNRVPVAASKPEPYYPEPTTKVLKSESPLNITPPSPNAKHISTADGKKKFKEWLAKAGIHHD